MGGPFKAELMLVGCYLSHYITVYLLVVAYDVYVANKFDFD